MHRDEENDEWGLGIYIRFNPLNHAPPLSVQFGLFLRQENGKLVFRTADSEPHAVDPNNEADWNALFANIVISITDVFKKPFLPKSPTEQPVKVAVNQYGFVVDLAPEP
jgi:hypothetical protein